ncbi:hypothetical protein OO007_12915 [Cocleimonas sp. KMM 6892]|uniref:hypothetical protein n=1 Tax=unclassified Cocleimonas TaxID=2639732 RepID=UPI002DB7B728|nr:MULTISPECIES: hypothetical protein [unclassified Cocleimonas]MEB8433132.1 hypothetical protein [Cocleimonas sp. KMM 6892]MEC4715887.1 hypothetical protein [Cocleimonas sp. KMM 6895]MEC4745348.1 hypothetical protein [Cocleimonas sp. KMM 6896]
MDNEFKKKLEAAEEAIDRLEDKIEDKVEDITEDLAEDARELWADLKKSFSGAKGKLKEAASAVDQIGDEARLQAHLGTMEVVDKMEGVKETLEDFTQKISSKAHTEIDTAKLRAHLAEMEAEDFMETKGAKIARDLNESGDKVKDASIKAAGEVKDYFDKLLEDISKSA